MILVIIRTFKRETKKKKKCLSIRHSVNLGGKNRLLRRLISVGPELFDHGIVHGFLRVVKRVLSPGSGASTDHLGYTTVFIVSFVVVFVLFFLIVENKTSIKLQSAIATYIPLVLSTSFLCH